MVYGRFIRHFLRVITDTLCVCVITDVLFIVVNVLCVGSNKEFCGRQHGGWNCAEIGVVVPFDYIFYGKCVIRSFFVMLPLFPGNENC